MRRLLLIVLGVFLLAGCGGNQSLEPVEINAEIDVCEICNMGIADEHYATEIISTDGDVYKFDDVGCMIEFLEHDKAIEKDKVAKQFVRDSETGEWVELEHAYHASHPDFWTPMANGVVSFKNKERAEAYIKEQGLGELLNYEQLKAHKWGFE